MWRHVAAMIFRRSLAGVMKTCRARPDLPAANRSDETVGVACSSGRETGKSGFRGAHNQIREKKLKLISAAFSA
ncbi:MAG: hypothetical protein ACLQPD_22030 [Desulfomonilaceae bacterium]